MNLSARLDLFPTFSIKTKYVNTGITINGSLLDLNATMGINVDLYNIAKDPKAALNYT